MEFFSYISLFLLLFDMAIPGANNVGVGSALFSIAISVVVIFFNGDALRRVLGVIGTLKSIFILYSIIFLYSISRVWFDDFVEPSFILSSAKAIFILIGVVFYIAAFGLEDVGVKIVNVFALNALICLVAGSNPDILAIVNIFKYSGGLNGLIPYRNAFLSGSGYYGMGAPYSMVFILAIHLLVQKGCRSKFIYFNLMLIAVGGVLAARTAFIGIFIGLSYLILRSTAKFFTVVIFLIIAIIFLLQFEQVSIFSNWIFELFVARSGSSTGTQSTDDLVTMYFIPSDYTLLFGDGRFSAGAGYYGDTDAGYMRNVLFGGVFFTCFIAAIPLVLQKGVRFSLFSFFIISTALILHIKGSFIFNNPCGMPLMILIFSWIKDAERKSSASQFTDPLFM